MTLNYKHNGQIVVNGTLSEAELSGQPGETSREPTGKGPVAGEHPSPLPASYRDDWPADDTNYLERQSHKDNVSLDEGWLIHTCDQGAHWFLSGVCTGPEHHHFKKQLYCDKEWCGNCGQDRSPAHNRRFMRWLPNLRQMPSLGYFVFTLPPELRPAYRKKKELTRLGHKIQEMLKGFGYYRGLRRWHWFGEKSHAFHPHLNCLVDGGFIPKERLAKIRIKYAKLLGVELADVHYNFSRTPGRMLHRLRYVTRATFRDWRWDKELALELHGFRNMVVWGRGQWDEPEVWQTPDLPSGQDQRFLDQATTVEKLVKDTCPYCGALITWSGAMPEDDRFADQGVEIATGYSFLGVKRRCVPISPAARAFVLLRLADIKAEAEVNDG